jgi:type II secretory pathway pseudopilin PulG
MNKKCSIKKRNAISLIEVLVTVAILSGGIVFIFRAFMTTLSAAKISQNIMLGCLLTEDRVWQIEQKRKKGVAQNNYSEEKTILQNREFNFKYEISDTDSSKLKKLTSVVSWPRNKQAAYSMDFFTYLKPDK